MRAPVLMDAPVLFPGRCLLCGRSKGKMVDTQVDDEGFGRVYVCADVCVPAVAKLIGLGDVAEERRRADAAEWKAAEAELELVDARPILAQLGKISERYRADDEPDELPRGGRQRKRAA